MRKDITIEKLMLGGEKVNKSELSRQYGCCIGNQTSQNFGLIYLCDFNHFLKEKSIKQLQTWRNQFE